MSDLRTGDALRCGVVLPLVIAVLTVALGTGAAAAGAEPVQPSLQRGETSRPSSVGPPPPELYPAYQINLELIDLLGRFFHREESFPEVREVTDVAAVKLDWWLEDPDQTHRDFNLFVLDARMGLIAYSVGLTGMGAYRDPGLVGATAIAVLASGRIGVITADGRLDRCLAFDGHSVGRSDDCARVGVAALALSAHGEGRFAVLTETGEVVAVEADSGALYSVHLASYAPESPTVVTSDGTTIAVVDRGGDRVRVFERAGPAGPRGGSGKEVFHPTVSAESIRVPFPDGTLSIPIRITDLARNRDGFFYLLSEPQDCLLTLDAGLEPRAYAMFPAMPIPFRRLRDVRGLALSPQSGLLHVFSPRAVSAYSETSDAHELVLRHTPPELVPVLQAIASIPVETFNPTGDLFEHPHVRPVLDAAFERLTAGLDRQ